jgi:hypothetical protein
LKVDRKELSDVLLLVSLYEFQDVRAESSVDHSFSTAFQENIHKISRKSESAVWRYWQAPLKRAILIALLAAIILTTIACATPAIRDAIIDFFFTKSEDGERYGITFDPKQAANAPHEIEEYWLPSYAPPDSTLVVQESSRAGVVYVWTDDKNGVVTYNQMFIPEYANETNWIGIDAEDVLRSSKVLNGYQVEIVSNQDFNQYTAIWTDNRYIYMVEVSNDNPNPERILVSIMESLIRTEIEGLN